ncbi:endonuclease MutS2 [Bacillus timonensis]|uniref:endonuclease MutS2 n=1 Tax=Bacillus timonensis TaxID=1033734 RepID=UPI000289A9D5|nr:DNA mismatch repair protein [Bacillus timonensis]
MNTQTMEALGYYQILNEISQFAKTNRGKETLLSLRPTQNKKKIEHSLHEITEAMNILAISGSIPIHSLDQIGQYIDQAKKGMALKVDQFTRIVSFLDHCQKLKQFMKDKEYAGPTVSLYAASIGDVSELETEISRCLRNGHVDDYASSDLNYLRRHLATGQEKLKEKAQSLVRSGRIAPYLQDTNISERSGRYVLAVKKEYRKKIQGTVLDTSASGSTLFIEPVELSTLQEEIELIKIAEETEVERILYELTQLFLSHEQVIQIAVETMHHYDVLFAKANYSRKIHATIPTINEEFQIHLKEARHPMLGNNAIPLTIPIGDKERALVITGPNTGGKTVTLKTVGLLTLMAQSGLPIPAKKGSEIAIFQHIFVDIGDGQSIEQNLSTFSSRMVNIIEILQMTNDSSLVLIDELGSGTDPREGMALAIVILEQLYEKGATLFATTHYSEMKKFADETEGFLNGSMEFDIQTLQPTYRLLLGKSGQSQAFDIAAKLGMHPTLLERAHQKAYQEEKDYHQNITQETLQSPSYQKQVIVNKYAHSNVGKSKQELPASKVTIFNQGDNVLILATGETGIVYKGPNDYGDYIVQLKGEKRTFNYKRIELKISAADLYPPDYDFDIIFKSKEYRKIKKDMNRKFVDGKWLEDDE